MSAVFKKTLTDIRRRKVQTAIVTLIVLLSSLTATLALTLLVESDAPFDRAFNQTQGAHLYVTFDSSQVGLGQVMSTTKLPVVSAAAGPWRVIAASVDFVGGRTRIIPVAQRDQLGGPVDQLTLDRGRWLAQSGEVVLSRQLADESGLQVGDTLSPAVDSPLPSLRIVGIAVAVGNDAAAWISPHQLTVTTSAKHPPVQYLVAYRLHHASTAADIRSATDAITRAVPAGSVLDTSNYLDAKLNADRTTAVMIPFLLAFSLFALLASAFIIANLVSGAVIAGTREIGIMKSLGYTPVQVVVSYAAQMLIPAAIGGGFGLPLGVLLSQPFLSDTAHAFGLPRSFGVAPGPDLLGLAAILGIVAITSVLASLRAGRLSAAQAIAMGSAPAGDGGSGSARIAARLPLPRSISLGLGESIARPVRSGMTIAAILIGVATVTFALGLHQSLTLVASSLTRDQQVQVQVYREAVGKSAGASNTEAQVESLINAQSGTARYVAVGHASVVLPAVSQPVDVVAYRGDSSWIGYVVIHGRWFNAPGEAVAPTAFYTQTGHRVGDTITGSLYGQPIQFKLVGEIFDSQYNNILLRTQFASLPINLAAWNYEIQLRPGTDPARYAGALESGGSGITARINSKNGVDTAFLLIDSVLAGLALVLVSIAIAGVFNTVVLNTRERARDIAILKAVGMTPPQVVRMILASVAVLGVAGALAGIPAGILLHRNILVVMGQIAAATAIPDPFFSVFPWSLIGIIVLAGVAIAMLGALLPAQWAARGRVAEILQAE
jgi:putative ABC transport system permease protein